MDIQNARILVRKLNSLFKSIDDAESQLSLIERDLMLSYLRQLYGLFLEEGIPTYAAKQEKSSPPGIQVPAPEPVAVKKPEPVQQVSLPQEPVFTEAEKKPLPADKAPEVVPAPVAAPEPEPAPRPFRSKQNPSLDQLFNFKKATELSERLSESPVQDLTKSMSINDRLLYINELFGRDRSALEDSLTLLNRFDGFEAAQSFLYSLAEQYHWGNEDRMEIAQSFIKLVRRRYLS